MLLRGLWKDARVRTIDVEERRRRLARCSPTGFVCDSDGVVHGGIADESEK